MTLFWSAAEEPKSASKQKKKRDAKKANKAATIEEKVEETAPKAAPAPASYLPKGIKEEQLQTDDPEKAKKIKNLKKVHFSQAIFWCITNVSFIYRNCKILPSWRI